MRRLVASGLLASLAGCADAPAIRPAADQGAGIPRADDDHALLLARATAQEAEAWRLLASGVRDRAIKAARGAFQIRLANLGALHPDTARALELVLEILLKEDKDLARAEEILREQIAAIEAQGGALHPALDALLVTLSSVAARRSEWDLMEATGTRLIALREANRGPASPELAAALLDLGVLRTNACRTAEAELLLTRALGIFVANGDFKGQIRALDEVARARWNAMDDAGAKSRVDQAIALGEAHEADSKGLVWRPLGQLASMLEARGDFAGARPIRERELAATERWAASDRGAVAEAALALATTCFALGDEAAAQAAYARGHVLARGRAEARSGHDPSAPRCHAPPSTGLIGGGPITNASQVVASMARSFRRCYNWGLQIDPNMLGSVRVTAHVGAGGQVTSATAPLPAGTLSDAVAGCVLDTVMRGSFAPPQGGGATIVIPLTFLSR